MSNLVSSCSVPNAAISRAISPWTRWGPATRLCGTRSSASLRDAHRSRSSPSIAARRSGSTISTAVGSREFLDAPIDAMGRAARNGNFVAYINRWSAAMPQPNDLSRSLVALDQDSTIIAVVEMSQSSWLVGGVLPGIERQPCKKQEPSPARLLALLHRWRDGSVRAGRTITRIAVAFEAGRDGFWLARWLEARGVEAHVIHPSSVAVSREHRRAKTDRLDTELLKRGFLGWLRGERGHCNMARVPRGGTHADCEPDKVHAGPAGRSQLQTDPAQGCRTSGNRAHPGGHAAAAQHLGRAAARHGAAELCCQPDPRDRAGSSETIRAAA